MTRREGQKHLIPCRCVLPQFKNNASPPIHHFVVFSIVEDDAVLPHFVQCNNCGIIHRIVDLCSSEIVTGREASSAVLTFDDLRAQLPEALVAALERVEADLPTWLAVKFTIDEARWGDVVVVTTERTAGLRTGKYVRILGRTLFTLDSFACDDIAELRQKQ